jgi:hypothetical protein
MTELRSLFPSETVEHLLGSGGTHPQCTSPSPARETFDARKQPFGLVYGTRPEYCDRYQA